MHNNDGQRQEGAASIARSRWFLRPQALDYRPQETEQHISNMAPMPNSTQKGTYHVPTAYACVPMALAPQSFEAQAGLPSLSERLAAALM